MDFGQPIRKLSISRKNKVEFENKFQKVTFDNLKFKGFPYFYVDFGTKNGLAHVIENEKYFSESFV